MSKTNTSRPFAAFDIDGTLIRWQLYHAVADELGRRGLLDTELYKAAKAARRTWKQRSPESSFNDYEMALVRTYDEAIKHVPASAIAEAIDSVLEEYKDQVYTYTRDLIRELKAQNYLLFAISGSQHDIVARLAEYYGFDDCYGTFYPQENGKYTGVKELVHSATKPDYLRRLVDKHGASFTGSYAVGDSESDIPMLSMVEHPVAFNPTAKLLNHAKQQQWDIVVERKNATYQLIAGPNGYGLK